MPPLALPQHPNDTSLLGPHQAASCCHQATLELDFSFFGFGPQSALFGDPCSEDPVGCLGSGPDWRLAHAPVSLAPGIEFFSDSWGRVSPGKQHGEDQLSGGLLPEGHTGRIRTQAPWEKSPCGFTPSCDCWKLLVTPG